jgi:hypothetical protein
MLQLSGLDELSCLNGSEQLIEKINEVFAFIRENKINISPSVFTIYNDTFTADLSLSSSSKQKQPFIRKRKTVHFSTIDELAYFRCSELLVSRIEEVLLFIRGKDYFVQIFSSRLDVKRNALAVYLSLSFSFKLPSLQLLIPSRLSGLEYYGNHEANKFLDSFQKGIS